MFPPAGATLQLVTVLITGVVGAACGMWVASMAGTVVPNSRLAAFSQAIAGGKVLMMVDVVFPRTQEIVDLVRQRHPEAMSGGTEPTIPAFPRVFSLGGIGSPKSFRTPRAPAWQHSHRNPHSTMDSICRL
jgi:uncharacterized membrane protein YeaQ/YmgE (transglycosylase-associated protein family)